MIAAAWYSKSLLRFDYMSGLAKPKGYFSRPTKHTKKNTMQLVNVKMGTWYEYFSADYTFESRDTVPRKLRTSISIIIRHLRA